MADVHAALAAILADLPSVGRDATNQAQGWNYRSYEAMTAAVHPLQAKHGVVFKPKVVDKTYEQLTKGWVATVTVQYWAQAADGSETLAGEVPGAGHDTFDKAMTKAMTYAYKTFLGQLFTMAEIDDPDSDTVDAGGTKSRVGGRNPKVVGTSGKPTPSPGNTADPSGGPVLPQDQAIAAHATQLGLTDDERVDAIQRVTGQRSGKDIRPTQVRLVFAELEAIAKAKSRG